MIYALGEFHHHLASRLLTPSATAYLLIATVILVSSLPISTYLRAHKKEPLLGVSIASGVLTGFVVVFAGKYYSAEGVALGYLGVMALVTPFVVLVWQRCRAEWHINSLLN
jgi:hypothetical protein